MGRAVRYHPLFDSDVLEAARWYDGKDEDLGADFVERVRRSVDLLIADPERRSPAEFGVRYWSVERFPYVVFYEINDFEVLILGAMHSSRESTKWLGGRLSQGGESN